MNTVRIPTRYKKQLSRLKDSERLWIFDSLLALASGVDIKIPDNSAGDLLELLWRDCVLMENKNGKLDIDTIGECVAGDSAGDSHSERKGKEVKGKEVKMFTPPTIEEINEYAISRGYEIDAGRIHEGYAVNDWKDSQGKPIKNWKMKLNQVWFSENNKAKDQTTNEYKLAYYLKHGSPKFREKYGNEAYKKLIQDNPDDV